MDLRDYCDVDMQLYFHNREKSNKNGDDVTPIAFQGEMLHVSILIWKFSETETSENFRNRWNKGCVDMDVDVQILKEDNTSDHPDKDNVPLMALVSEHRSCIKPALTMHQSECRSAPSTTMDNDEKSLNEKIQYKSNLEGLSPDVVLSLEVPVSVKPEYLGMDLLFVVSASLSTSNRNGLVDHEGIHNVLFNEDYEKIFSKITQQQAKPPTCSTSLRQMSKLIRVIQPIQIDYSQAYIGNTATICIKVKNTHESLPTTLHDLHFHLNSTRNNISSQEDSIPRCLSDELPNIPTENANGTTPLDFSTIFRSALDLKSIPAHLAPGEQHNFILHIAEKMPDGHNIDGEHSPDGASSSGHLSLSGEFKTLFTVSWSNSLMLGPVVHQHTIAWNRPHGSTCELSLAITGKSPVHAFKETTMVIEMINTSFVSRDITVLFLSKQSQAFVSFDKNSLDSIVSEKKMTVTAAELLSSATVLSNDLHEAFHRNPSNNRVESTIGIEASLHLGFMPVNATVSANLHFIPLQFGKIVVDNIMIYDSISEQYYHMEKPWEIFAV